MRRELAELAALETFEAGKPAREADADVGEAIDFLEYYAREALRLAAPRRMGDAPGELNHYFYQPRGVAVVIAPWNFPLAILTGMTAAALVTGNTVIVKPAGPDAGDRRPARAHPATRPARRPAAVTFLPGRGETWPARRSSAIPRSHLIAFTGSREVGLHIMERAVTHPGRAWVKRVIAEMGGKNAIIVDADADLDAAVLETVASAFSYAGQKCSACSRVIVLDEAHDEFVARLVEATRSLAVGPPEDPPTRVPPVISLEAKTRIEEYIEQGRREATVALATPAPPGGWPDDGFYVGPHIFTGVDRQRDDRPGGDLRPRPGRAARARLRRGARDRPRLELRAHRRALLAQPGEHRPRATRVQGRQPLHQPRHHRRHGRAPGLRRLRDERHRLQGRRPRLPAAVRRAARGHREHAAPRLRAARSRSA